MPNKVGELALGFIQNLSVNLLHPDRVTDYQFKVKEILQILFEPIIWKNERFGYLCSPFLKSEVLRPFASSNG